MRKIFLIMIIASLIINAQDNCNCNNALKKLINKIENEYPGFHDKTKDKLVYNNFKENLLKKSQSVKESFCIELLRNYKEFFKDGHISIYQIENGQNISGRNQLVNKVHISSKEFLIHLENTKDPLEGIWKSGSYKVGIIKSKQEYLGFIIEADTTYWKPSEIKFRLLGGGKAKYLLRDHSPSDESYELVDDWILFFSYAKFIKEFPIPNVSESELQLRTNEIEGCFIKKLTEKTVLLSISSFEHIYVDRIKSIIINNKNLIENSDNLIIDVRNNLGGVYEAYEYLFPYILSNNIRGVGMEFLVTQTLIDEIPNWYDDEEGKKKAAEWIKTFKQRKGEFVNTDSTDVHVTKVKISSRSPKHVVILVNNRTASSGEAFVFDAMQSKKVKVLGIPTYGALDYGSASFFDIGCTNFKLMMPTWRSMRLPNYPIDNIGIQPDVYIDKSVKDWIKFALDYLEN